MTIRRIALAVAVLAVAALAGCGVSPERDPRPIDQPKGPFGALASSPPAVTASGSVPERLFLVKDGMITAVTRHVEREPTLDELIADLLNGPNESEGDAGMTSALLGGQVVSEVHLDGGQAMVELALPTEGTGRTNDVLAYAQVVCTLTARPDVRGVVFTRDQQAVGVPRADGQLSLGPLTAADYAALVAPR
jgi:hypothetical protein